MNGQRRCSCVWPLSAESFQGFGRDCLRVEFVTRWDKKLLTSWKVISVIQVVNVGCALVHPNTFLVDHVARMLTYFHTLVKEKGLPILKGSTSNNVSDMRSSDFLHEMSTLTYRLYPLAVKQTLRHRHSLDVVKELKGIISVQPGVASDCPRCPGVCRARRRNQAILVRAGNAFIRHENAAFHAHPFYQHSLPFFNQVRKDYNCFGRELLGTWDQFLRPSLITQSLPRLWPALFFSTNGFNSNIILLIDVDIMRCERKWEILFSVPGFQEFLHSKFRGVK